jgi:hypothetical protein
MNYGSSLPHIRPHSKHRHGLPYAQEPLCTVYYLALCSQQMQDRPLILGAPKHLSDPPLR